MDNEEQKEIRDTVEDLLLQNATLNALIKGLEEDIVTLENENVNGEKAADIVRFTIQLNVMKDKKNRNLAAINAIAKNERHNS